MVSIDFEKCFDHIEHRSIFGMLKYFNFGDNFIQVIKLFFHDFEVCTQNAGHLSNFFRKTSGVNQGYPISPLLYLGTSEIMAHMISNNPNIKGIEINNVRHVITQFTDNTGLFLEYEENTLVHTISTLEHVEHAMGLKVSYDKTHIYRIGSLKGSNAKLYTNKNLVWTDDDIELLGVKIVNAEMQNSNSFDETITKMGNVAKSWSNRTLTLTGKVLIVNTLMASLFVYKMCILPKMSKAQLASIKNIVQSFLWNGKHPKIPLNILKLSQEVGGLNLVNFEDKHIALRLQWVSRIRQYPLIESYAYGWLCPILNQLIWKCNLCHKDISKICTMETYWTDVLRDWCKINF